MLRFELPLALCSLTVLAAITAVDYLVFDALGGNYFGWYLQSAFIISLLFGVVAVVISLDRHIGLIAVHPFVFAAEVSAVLAELSGAITQGPLGRARSDLALAKIGHPYVYLQTRFRPRGLDTILSILFSLVLAATMLAWVFVVAPLQYWVTLVCGAPARAALASEGTYWAAVYPFRTEYVLGDKDQQELLERRQETAAEPSELTEISFARRPVTFTAAISAAVIWGVSQLS